MSRSPANPLARTICALALVACGDGAAGPVGAPGADERVAAIVVTAGVDTLAVGESGRLVAVAVDARGTPLPSRSVRWTGSDPGRASVAPDGSVVGLAPGTLVATAATDGHAVSVSVSIRDAALPVGATIDLFPRAAVLAPGAAHLLAPLVRDAAGAVVAAGVVEFRSSDPGIATVDAQGRVVARAPGTARVEAVIGGLVAASTVTVDAAPPGAFDVALRLVGDAAILAAEAERAAARWERVLGGDLSDLTLALPAGLCGAGVPALVETVDDILVVVRLDSLDGPGETLASARPCVTRQGDGLPAIGVVRLDVEDVALMREAGVLEEVIAHEIGHVLGIGTSWPEPSRGLLADVATSSPSYLGARARRAAASLGFTTADESPVPLEGTGGGGTRGLHWREALFARELMTGWIDAGAPLSAVTVGALADLGYAVREAGADPFSSVLADARVAALVGARPTSLRLVEQVGDAIVRH